MIETQPPVIFISYAHADRAVVHRLAADLHAAGIVAWMDDLGLEPGTASWEQALRQAIRAAVAVVLVASPAAAGSRYVPDELDLARTYQCPVYPFWVDGEHWMECVPLGWGRTQMLDARGDAYAAALPRLLQALQTLASPAGERSRALGQHAKAGIPRNPYKGLRAFVGEDAGDFFGREQLIAALLDTLRDGHRGRPRLLAVLGASGSGKSSLVRAGLVPQLQRGAIDGSDRWIYLEPVLPGAQPLEALAVSLANALTGASLHTLLDDLRSSPRGLHLLGRRMVTGQATRAVLVIDQFEEVFTLTTSEEERRQLIELLVTAASEPGGPLMVILTLRADFYDRPLSYPALGALLEGHGKSILPMSIDDLRAAIEGPAGLPDVRLRFEGDLVGDLLLEVHGQAGALPLLQFTLDQLYQQREGRLLSLAAYTRLGGVRGALAQHAEATYQGLPTDDHRHLARALFLRLIDPGATEQDTTRRRAAAAELVLADAERTIWMRQAADAFVEARLLTANARARATTLEVSHEALIREWARLGDWLREAREDIRLQQRLSEDAGAWRRRDCPTDHLYRGLVLDEALVWADRNTPSALELEFLTAGLAERYRQEAEEQERQTRQLALAQQAARADRRAAVRLRYLAAVLALSLVVASGLSVFALNSADDARRNAHSEAAARATAVADRTLSQSRQLAAQAISQLDDRYDLALLLSVEANRLDNTTEARDSLLRSLAYNPRLITYLHGSGQPVDQVAFSSDGHALAAGRRDGTLQLWDSAHWQPLGATINGPKSGIYALAFSPNGKSLAVGSYDGVIRFWDVANHLPLGAPLKDPRYGVYNLAESSDGKFLVSGSDLDAVIVWDLTHRRIAGRPLVGGREGVPVIALSRDNRTVAAGSLEGTVLLWDLARRSSVYLPTGSNTGEVSSVAFSPNGSMVAAGFNAGAIQVWNAARRRSLGPVFAGHTTGVDSLAFSPDGTILASGSADSTVRLWDIAHHRALGPPLLANAGRVNSVAFSRDGATIAAGCENGSVVIWSIAGRPSLGPVALQSTGSARSLALDAEGREMAVGNDNGAVSLWPVGNAPSPTSLLTVHPSDARSLALSGNGGILAAGSDDGGIQLWDVASRRALGTPLAAQTGGINAVAFSPDDNVLASGSDDASIQLWDAASRKPLGRPLLGHTFGVTSLSFSPTGSVLVSGGYDGTIRFWDVRRNRPLGPALGHAGDVNSVAFSPDGSLVAAGAQNGSIQLWDVAHRRASGLPFSDLSGITSLAFTAGSTTLAAGNADGTIQLWNLATRQSLGPPLAGHTGAIARLLFSADGKTLVSASLDGSVRRWNLEPSTLIRAACAIANRDLTRQEWQQYLADQPYTPQCLSSERS